MSRGKEAGWKEVPQAGIIREAGNAETYETGDWRSTKPIRDEKKCINCLLCWVYCPEGAIIVEDGKVVGIDMKHCKGCGICAKECPEKIKAIKMVNENE